MASVGTHVALYVGADKFETEPHALHSLGLTWIFWTAGAASITAALGGGYNCRYGLKLTVYDHIVYQL